MEIQANIPHAETMSEEDLKICRDSQKDMKDLLTGIAKDGKVSLWETVRLINAGKKTDAYFELMGLKKDCLKLAEEETDYDILEIETGMAEIYYEDFKNRELWTEARDYAQKMIGAAQRMGREGLAKKWKDRFDNANEYIN